MAIYSGGSQVEAFFGKHLKIGFCRKDILPNSGDYNLWYEGSITNFSQSGGDIDTETVKCMGGVNRQYQKSQNDFELTLEVIPTDTTFEEMWLGWDGMWIDLFDSYADNTALQSAWTAAGDAAAAVLDTSTFNSGKQSAKLAFTHSTGSATWTYDVSTTQGSTFDLSSFTGSSGTPTRGRIEMIVYIPDTTTQGHITKISVQIGSDSSNYVECDYTVSGNTIVGWNKLIYDMSSGSVTGTPDWTAVDHFQIKLTVTDGTSEYIYVDRIRAYDPLIESDNVPGYWRTVLIYETNSASNVGEKRRAVFKDCKVSSWEPSSDADGYFKGKLTLKFPPTDSSGNPNISIEHTPDASKAPLTSLSAY